MDRYSKAIDLRKLKRDNNWRLEVSTKQREIATQLLEHTFTVENCPICGSKESKYLVSIHGYPYSECHSCEHVYSTAPPNPEKISELYSEDDSGNVLSLQSDIYAQKDLFNQRLEEIASPKVKFASDLIPQRGLWVDIGAGAGDLVLAASSMGWNAKGYESDSQLTRFANMMGANVEALFLTEQNMGIVSEADVVSTINVLEHIIDPKSFVNSISAKITPGTYYLFEVPRFPSISSLANICFPNYAARNLYSPDHLHLFSDYSMNLMLKEARLNKISTWFFGQDVYELVGNCLLEGDFDNHHLISKVLALTNDLQEIVDANGLSDTMLVLARKSYG
ncbi:MAG: hypothetical protein CMJ80_00540 [Planctomycetaceae bacterium]|nr:hypothetical protein [Planctomycetaceae bacterium]